MTARDVEVTVNQTIRVDLELPVGDTSESVSVTAETPLVQADQVTIGQVVNNRSISELPLNGRDYTTLLRLNTGVTEVQGGITTSTPPLPGCAIRTTCSITSTIFALRPS